MELIVVGFQDRYRAAQVLTDLRQRGVHLFDLDQAITVSWEDRRNFVVQQSVNLGREEGSRWARLWGAFIKATLFQPFTDRLSTAAAKVASTDAAASNGELTRDWWVGGVGIPENFVRDVGALVQPGESAIISVASRSAVALSQTLPVSSNAAQVSASIVSDQR